MAAFELYLVRHAVAEIRGGRWPDDGLRPLTPQGTARFTTAVAGLEAAGAEVDEIWTSPLVRARQTAELLRKGLGNRPRVRVLTALSPGHNPAQVLTALARHRPARRIALVGHEPSLGNLAGELLGTRKPVALKKGAVCRIDAGQLRAGGSGALVWLLPPRVLRALGR